MNINCYYFKNISYDCGLFDSFVDMTYVLIMENSKREENMYKELNFFKPTSRVKIQYNAGFKKCKKKLYQQKTNWDLMDATYNIMIDAKKNGYKNILILEEDFIVNNKQFTETNITNIKDYITNNDIDIYLFGNFVPSINITLNSHLKCLHRKLPCGGTQGYITTDCGIKKFIELYESEDYDLIKNKSDNGDIDWLYNDEYFKTYYYKIPLIIQPMEETENLSNTNFPEMIKDLVYSLKLKYINLFGLNSTNKEELIKNYDNLYLFSKLIVPVLIIIIIIVIYIIYNRF